MPTCWFDGVKEVSKEKRIYPKLVGASPIEWILKLSIWHRPNEVFWSLKSPIYVSKNQPQVF